MTFRPPWVCEAEYKLTLTNPNTKDEFEYDIKGYGEEPLAERHIVVNCKAKKTEKVLIELDNKKNDKPMLYTVQTDESIFTGPENIKVRANGVGKYYLNVTPLLG